jgi:hypothetical protein
MLLIYQQLWVRLEVNKMAGCTQNCNDCPVFMCTYNKTIESHQTTESIGYIKDTINEMEDSDNGNTEF